MTYLTVKMIKGNPYLYEVRSEREGDKVRQVFVRYLGRADKEENIQRQATHSGEQAVSVKPEIVAVPVVTEPSVIPPEVEPEIVPITEAGIESGDLSNKYGLTLNMVMFPYKHVKECAIIIDNNICKYVINHITPTKYLTN